MNVDSKTKLTIKKKIQAAKLILEWRLIDTDRFASCVSLVPLRLKALPCYKALLVTNTPIVALDENKIGKTWLFKGTSYLLGYQR